MEILQAPFNLNWFEFDLAVSIEEDIASELKVYPNPSNGRINVTGEAIRNVSVWLTLSSITGEVVYKSLKTDVTDQLTLPLLDLPNGEYILEVTQFDGTRQYEKIVIMN
jgi:hypothetical protein